MNALIGAMLALLGVMGVLLYVAKGRKDDAEKKVLDLEQKNRVQQYNAQRQENLKSILNAKENYEKLKTGIKNLFNDGSDDGGGPL